MRYRADMEPVQRTANIGELQRLMPIRVAHLESVGIESSSARAFAEAIALLPAEDRIEFTREDDETHYVIRYRYAPRNLVMVVRLVRRTAEEIADKKARDALLGC